MIANEKLRALRDAHGWTQEEAATRVASAVYADTGKIAGGIIAAWIGRLERGQIRWPITAYRAALRTVYGVATDAELGLYGTRGNFRPVVEAQTTESSSAVALIHAQLNDEEDALELARRVAASDVGAETITRLESVFDDLAVAYPVTPPREMIERIRLHLGYVSKLMDARKTLDEHRRLVVVGGWLSLLGATVHIDLKQYTAAEARLQTASSLARSAEQEEIRAWCLETKAWRVLTQGDYPQAVKLAQMAQGIAPANSSARIQATAQEGRAWARLHQSAETRDAMKRVEKLVNMGSTPDRPGHHYQYDPDKFTAYSTTTLAWLGDPAAETYARELITRLRDTEGNGKWPRRLASANLDLALSLLVTNRLDEAAASALSAISSGHVAPSNQWRALEIVAAVEAHNLPEATDLRGAYEELRSNQQ